MMTEINKSTFEVFSRAKQYKTITSSVQQSYTYLKKIAGLSKYV